MDFKLMDDMLFFFLVPETTLDKRRFFQFFGEESFLVKNLADGIVGEHPKDEGGDPGKGIFVEGV